MISRRLLVAAVVALGLIAVVPVAIELFVPERSTVAVADAAVIPPDAVALRTGTFTGADAAHHVEGRVTLYRDGEGHFLLFEEYDQTQGPDVFVYLTPGDAPNTRSDVEAGVRVLVDGGADGGESTVTGTFVQRLPDDVGPTGLNGVSIWCDRFSVAFGFAPLAPV